jgi:hypothetical protein
LSAGCEKEEHCKKKRTTLKAIRAKPYNFALIVVLPVTVN